MFVYSVKTSKKKVFILLGILVAIIVIVIIFFNNSTDVASKTPTVNVAATTNDERIAFLSQYGWKVRTDAVEVMEVTIPSVFDEVYTNYNDLQIKQDFDLSKYADKRVKRWTYAITNYPGYSEDSGLIHANLLVYEDKVIGGDIMSIELAGFMHGFKKDDASETATSGQTTAPSKADDQEAVKDDDKKTGEAASGAEESTAKETEKSDKESASEKTAKQSEKETTKNATTKKAG